MIEKIQTAALFVSRKNGTSKDGRAYDIVELSNGLKSRAFNNPKPTFDYSDLKQGQSLDCIFSVDAFSDRYNIELIDFEIQ